MLALPSRGDLIASQTAGAYEASFASRSNGRTRPALALPRAGLRVQRPTAQHSYRSSVPPGQARPLSGRAVAALLTLPASGRPQRGGVTISRPARSAPLSVVTVELHSSD